MEVINTSIIIFITIAILIGVGLGILLERRKNDKHLESINAEAKEILNHSRREADRIKSEKMLQAKERFIEMKSEHEKHVFRREKNLSDIESRLRDKENKLNNFYNISNVFNDKNETYYIDGGHLNELGNKIVSNKIYEIFKHRFLSEQ